MTAPLSEEQREQLRAWVESKESINLAAEYGEGLDDISTPIVVGEYQSPYRPNGVLSPLHMSVHEALLALLAEVDRLTAENTRSERMYYDLRGRLIRDGHHVEFADLPSGTRNALIGNGYYTRAQVAHATDDQLLACLNLGTRSLAKIRAVMPYEPTP